MTQEAKFFSRKILAYQKDNIYELFQGANNFPRVVRHSDFSYIIEDRIKQGVDPLDAIISYADESGLEIEFVAGLVKKNPSLKAILEEHARDLNFLEKK